MNTPLQDDDASDSMFAMVRRPLLPDERVPAIPSMAEQIRLACRPAASDPPPKARRSRRRGR